VDDLHYCGNSATLAWLISAKILLHGFVLVFFFGAELKLFLQAVS
jgi:hypothetical protein